MVRNSDNQRTMLNQDTPGQELLQDLSSDIECGNIIVSDDFDQWFDKIWKNFPFTGSKIAWSKVPESIELEIDKKDYEESIVSFFINITHKAGVDESDVLVVVGDSSMNFSLQSHKDTLSKILLYIVSMPQHTYIIPIDSSWCLCYTMEGYMSFGFSTNLLLSH